MKENSLCNNTQKMQENALEYAEKKYNMKFNIIGIESREILEDISNAKDTIWLCPENGNREDEEFQVICTHNKDGKDTFKDDYFGILLSKDYEKQIRKIGDKYFSNYTVKLFFSGDYFPEEFNSECTVQEAIEKGAELFPTIRISTDSYKDDKNKFYELSDLFIHDIANEKLSASVNIFCLDEDKIKEEFNGDFIFRRSAIIDKNFNIDTEEE